MAETYDIYYALLPELQQTHGKLFSFIFQGAIGVRGPQKMVNRWLKCFMTTKGTDPTNLNYGTQFNSLFFSNVSKLKDIQDLVSVYIDDCNAQIKAFDRKYGLPPEERLQNATLESLLPDGVDGVAIQVLLRNQANASFPLVLPTLTVT